MTRRSGWIALAALGVVVALAGIFFASFERKDVTEVEAARGEARYNPFFALQQILERLGQPAHSLASLDPQQLPLAPGDTLLIGDDASRIDRDAAGRIVAWVHKGGHLLLSPGDGNTTHAPMFDALGLLDPHPAKHGCSTLQTAQKSGSKDHAALCGTRFRLAPTAASHADAVIGEAQDGYLFARTTLGKGTVSVLADFAPLSRNGLKSAAAQQLAWRLLAPNRGRGTVYLIYALDGPAFLHWLSVKGWPALLALAALLGAWMAMRSARLGPLLPHPAPHRRALLDHVQASGEFLYRRDGGRSLHRLACDATLARLRGRDAACSALHGDALYARLAERSALDAAQIAQAFQPPANAQAFRTSITTLARLGSRP